MLEPEARKLLAELLDAPEGFALDELLVCTYSLDLVALAGVPLICMNMEPRASEVEAGTRIAAMEAVRRFSTRMTVVCQAGAIHVPDAYRDAFLWLERSVVQITPKAERGVFHPKVWLLRFKGAEGVRYRVVVASRNLTFDRSWDVAAALDGELTSRKNSFGANAPLVDFVQALGGPFAPFVGSASGEHVQRLQRFASELTKVRFEHADKEVSDWAFWPVGIPGHQYEARHLFDDRRGPFQSFVEAARRRHGRRLMVLAPFVSPGMVKALASSQLDVTLVSRQDTLDAVASHIPRDWISSEECKVHEFLDTATDAATELSGLHAKLWVADDGNDAHLWMGSANATDAAFGRNIEFLLQLSGRKSQIGIDSLLGTADAVGTLTSIVMPFRVSDDAINDEDAAIEKRRRELGWVLTGLIAQQQLAAYVESREDGWRIVATMDANASLRANGKSAEWWACPVTLDLHRASAQGVRELTAITYEGLALTDLTLFWTVALRQEDIEVQATVRLEPVGDMPGFGVRESAVVARHLQDAQSLGLYLEFLLAGGDDELGQRFREQRRRRRRAGNGGELAVPLFETLLRALASRPEALSRVAEFLDGTIEAASGLASNPDFMSLWQAVGQARELLGATHHA
jgi:hypothetical protein